MPIYGDDPDIRDVQMYMDAGNNGDYYLSLIEFGEEDNESKAVHFRLALSGGHTNSRYPEVVKAFIALYRAMEKEGLNDPPSGPLKVH